MNLWYSLIIGIALAGNVQYPTELLEPFGFEQAEDWYSNITVHADWRFLWFETAIHTDMRRKVDPGYTFAPNQVIFSIDAGVFWKDVKIGAGHTCYHPFEPYRMIMDVMTGGYQPAYEGSSTTVYLQIGGER